jgi:hypothetical protein
MPTCICNNIAFIHIPKTAGTSMTLQLKNANKSMVFNEKYANVQDTNDDFKNMYLDHLPAFLVKKYEKHNYDKMLAYVRNPYSRFISMFCQGKVIELHSYDISIQGIKQFCNEFSLQRNAFYNPMSYYIYDVDNKTNLVDYIFSYESLQDSINSVAKITQTNMSNIQVINYNKMTDNTKYMQWYTKCPILYDFVNEFYIDDFRKFDYNML